MGVSPDSVVQALNNNPSYRARFRTVFGGDPNAIYVQEALGAFVNSITSGKSDFDHGTLDAAEKRGADLFFGKARCAACHNGTNFTDELTHETSSSSRPRASGTLTSPRRTSTTAPRRPSMTSSNSTSARAPVTASRRIRRSGPSTFLPRTARTLRRSSLA
jgi:cytochrome c peroxidase